MNRYIQNIRKISFWLLWLFLGVVVFATIAVKYNKNHEQIARIKRGLETLEKVNPFDIVGYERRRDENHHTQTGRCPQGIPGHALSTYKKDERCILMNTVGATGLVRRTQIAEYGIS